mgnify:CR=1 FL=1
MSRLMRELNPNLGYYDALNYENVSDGVRLVIDESESVNLSDELRKLLTATPKNTRSVQRTDTEKSYLSWIKETKKTAQKN